MDADHLGDLLDPNPGKLVGRLGLALWKFNERFLLAGHLSEPETIFNANGRRPDLVLGGEGPPDRRPGFSDQETGGAVAFRAERGF